MGDPLTGKTHWVKFTRGMEWEHLCISQEEAQRATRTFLDSMSKEDIMALAEKTGVKLNRAMKRGKGLS